MAETKKQPAATTPLVNNPRSGVVGLATKFLKDKYQPNSNVYPIDLFAENNPYGDNYVVFYINVPESSKLISQGFVKPVDRDTVEIGSSIAQTNSKLGNTIASTGIGAAVGAGAGALAKGVKGAIVGGAIGAVGGYAASSLIPNRQNKRISETITLNIPNSLTSRYSVNWDAEDMVLASAAGDIAAALSNKNSSQSVSESGAAIAANVALSKLPGGNITQALSGVAPNPKKEQLFKNVDFRTFNFEYQFAPRNEQESRNVKDIIKLFKLHMHPEFKDTSGFLFLYPSEFEIVYYQGGSENMNLPRHTSSVLVDMSVNYTPQGMFNTFEDGASTLITINLTFKELAILTKAEIMDGF